MISCRTITLLIDAGLGGDTLKQITAAFQSDLETACNMLRVTLRNNVTLSDAGSVTPAALRMRKMREKSKVSANLGVFEQVVTDRNGVTSQSVTSYINLSSSKEVLSEGSKKEIELPTKRNRRNIGYTELFETFWKAYPTDQGMSKLEAFKSWGKLSLEDQDRAIAGIAAFKAWATKQAKDYRTVHAVRYLSQRRFDGFAGTSSQTSFVATPQVFVSEQSEAFKAWEKHLGRSMPASAHSPYSRAVTGWYFPTEYPPSP